MQYPEQTNNMINLSKIDEDIQRLSEHLNVDLSMYGNASPIKLMIESLKAATRTLQDTMLLLNNEQNPLTATHFKSKLGLAALQSLNPAKMLVSASGKVTIDNKGLTIRIAQHAKLRSETGIEYYVQLPAESILITEPTEIVVKQGSIKELNEILTGELWQSITLPANDYVDTASINVYMNGRRLSVGLHLDDEADCYVSVNMKGDTEIILDKKLPVTAGDSVNIVYSDSIGIYGDNLVVNEIFTVDKFAFSGDDDVSKNIEVYISMPIIGGTDFDNFNKDLSNEIRFAGKNNLIGTEKQMLQYVKRFKQYIVQTSKLTDGVLTLTCHRSIEQQMKMYDYWMAIQNIAMTDNDIRSLVYHLNHLSRKSIDLLVNAIPARISQCKANVTIEGSNINHNVIANAIVEYAVNDINSRNYEIGKLYKAVLSKYDITEVHCELETMDELSTQNKFGTISPKNVDTILVLSYTDITINGETFQYGQYN